MVGGIIVKKEVYLTMLARLKNVTKVGGRMNEELKSCPFCGGTGIIKAVNKNYGLTIWCQCKKCGARTEGYCPSTNNEDETIESIEQCKNRAVTLWNRRANDGKAD